MVATLDHITKAIPESGAGTEVDQSMERYIQLVRNRTMVGTLPKIIAKTVAGMPALPLPLAARVLLVSCVPLAVRRLPPFASVALLFPNSCSHPVPISGSLPGCPRRPGD